MRKHKNHHSSWHLGGYFWRSRLLPKPVRDDAFKLYSFVSTVRGYALVQRVEEFEAIEHRWKTIAAELDKRRVPTPLDDSASEHVLANMAYLVHRHSLDGAWVDAFLKSMRWDLQKHQYRSFKDLQDYMYGSAEVIGLMIVKMLGLPEESMKAARVQARAMQYISFLQHVSLDYKRGQTYFPLNDIKKFGLKDVSEDEARKKPGMFADFMHAELMRYAQWQSEANEGFAHIPRRVRVPLETTIDVNNWIARQLKYKPLEVFEQVIRPPKHQVVRRVVRHSITK